MVRHCYHRQRHTHIVVFACLRVCPYFITADLPLLSVSHDNGLITEGIHSRLITLLHSDNRILKPKVLSIIERMSGTHRSLILSPSLAPSSSFTPLLFILFSLFFRIEKHRSLLIKEGLLQCLADILQQYASNEHAFPDVSTATNKIFVVNETDEKSLLFRTFDVIQKFAGNARDVVDGCTRNAGLICDFSRLLLLLRLLSVSQLPIKICLFRLAFYGN